MRLDKYLSDCNLGTRSQIKDFIRKGDVWVDGKLVKKPETSIDELTSDVVFKGQKVNYKRFTYIILNKPTDIVTASRDNKAKTVMDLIKPLPCKDLFAVGRLDKDTTGLLLICNDGDLSHKLLSPKYHVDKTYEVTPKLPLSDEDLLKLSAGVDIGDEKPTLPAKAEIKNDLLYLTIHEGRYHQVKRMLEAVDNEVVKLHRISFGNLDLPADLAVGEWRELSEDEVNKAFFG